MKQSSDELSALAAKYMRFNIDDIEDTKYEQASKDVRRLAASVLSQDETPFKRLKKWITRG